jgi:cytochrome c peroxidase
MANTWTSVTERLQHTANYPRLFYLAFGTQTIDSILVVKALAQFERTLLSFNSRFDQKRFLQQQVFTEQEKNGEIIFFQVAKCAGCHNPPFMTEFQSLNNGLDALPADSGLAKVTHDPRDYGKFRTPTLRNIALTAPYMHDGRFNTLEEVVTFYSTGVAKNSPNLDGRVRNIPMLTPGEKDDLVAFLKTLTDNSFIINPDFKQP